MTRPTPFARHAAQGTRGGAGFPPQDSVSCVSYTSAAAGAQGGIRRSG